MSRPFRTLFFALGLGLALPVLTTACGDKNLQETTVPAEGVTLRYALAPGAAFAGHVNQRESVQGGQVSMNRSLDFTVNLRVTGQKEDGSAQVEAVVSNLDITWALPPNMPYSVGEFIEGARKKIDGVTIRFVVTRDGQVEDMPPMPEGLDGQERLVLQAVLDGLASAFLVVPENALKQGEQWVDEGTRGRQGKLGKYSEWKTTSSFDGLFDKTDTSQKVAKLTIETNKTDTTTTKSGGHETNTRSKTTALFDIDADYLVSLTGTETKFDSGETTTRKFSTDWTRSSAGATPAPTEVQQIDDPCHPDYVGPGECKPAGEDGTEVQQIDDPCNPDYVGPGECKEGGDEGGAEGGEGEEEAAEGEAAEASAESN
jgi:hypothetical protein